MGIIKEQDNQTSLQRTTGGTPAVLHRYRQNQYSGQVSEHDTKFSAFDVMSIEPTTTIDILKTVETVTDSNESPASIIRLQDIPELSSVDRKPGDDYSV